jgi:hypothetical protein
MLPLNLYYPIHWPLMYKARNNKEYACIICSVHHDAGEAYYTIDVIEGPYKGERQTVRERLYSWVDMKPISKIHKYFEDFRYNTGKPNF